MTRRSRWSLVLTLFFAVGQVCLPAVLSVADAMVWHNGQAAAPHVEDTSNVACHPTHSGDCALCGYLSALVGVAATPAFASAEVPGQASIEFANRTAGVCPRYGFLSRAPPSGYV